MFLIDNPYVSDFLLDTIEKNQYPVVKTEQAKHWFTERKVNWIEQEQAVIKLKTTTSPKLYTNSENAIDWVFQNIQDLPQAKWIESFKNKVKFREIIQDIFPEFYFKTIQINEIQNFDIQTISLPFVIKPAVGFFSLGVHIIYNKNDWEKAKKELNPESLKNIYPKNVVDISTFIIEEFIQGEEYAVDCYFNEKGEAVLLNILHHKFSSGTDVSDRVYYSSKEIILKYKDKLTDFLNKIGKKLSLKNFPIHLEVRIDKNEKIVPIEVNPMRFGGWCTTADLTYYSYGFNPYEYFMENKIPDWNQILKNRDGIKYALILLDNDTGIEASNIKDFDYNRLSAKFEKVLLVRKLDVKKYSVFGFLFIATKNEDELDYALTANLQGFVTQ